MINIIRDIYSAKLTFKRNSGEVIVDIRPAKIGESRRKSLPIPKDIISERLSWMKYQGNVISIYHRKIRNDNYEYRDQMNIIAPTSLCQRLEQLVSNVCSNIYSVKK
jgi:hypothetical protein